MSKIKQFKGTVYYYDDFFDIVCEECDKKYTQKEKLNGLKKLYDFGKDNSYTHYKCSVCQKQMKINLTESWVITYE